MVSNLASASFELMFVAFMKSVRLFGIWQRFIASHGGRFDTLANTFADFKDHPVSGCSRLHEVANICNGIAL